MEHTIHLIFSTTAGDLEKDFPLNQPLHAVKSSAMAQLGLDPSTADQFIVSLNGTQLDESKKLGELNLDAGSVLILERKDLVKI